MWPYFTVPLEGHIRQVWLYSLSFYFKNMDFIQYQYLLQRQYLLYNLQQILKKNNLPLFKNIISFLYVPYGTKHNFIQL